MIVGIDLGTTNSALAYVSGEEVLPLTIPQVVHPNEVRAESLLPSFLYLQAAKEFPEGALSLPWEDNPPFVTGSFARRRGAEVQARLISSAKSWLSYTGHDPNSAFLPLGVGEGSKQMSPVEASCAYLEHLNEAWQAAGNTPLSQHEVVLTVPASFDAAARELTQKAAAKAGLKKFVLLEEPQAAFYAWIEKHADWRERIPVGARVLIIDIGGGTTDFTLVDVKDQGGSLTLERVAVGEHILLGGDNMDLSLARHVEAQLAARNTKLDAQQLQALWQQCRQAKEVLLDPEAPQAEQPITILGRGSSLIGSTIKTKLSQAEAQDLILEGFFPPCALDAEPQRARRSALQELALPYAADAGITRHLARFLKGAGALPTHVLFNGGVLRAGMLRTRVLDVVNTWLPNPIQVLEGEDLMLAVARGAAYFGMARQGKGIRIRGGIPRTYYVGIEDAMPAVPGLAPRMKALTVVPFGMEEGASLSFENRKFGLYVGEPVEFRLFVSNERRGDEPGDLLDPMPPDLTELPPMEVTLHAANSAMVPVSLASHVTETGMLELYCVSAAGEKWKLAFNVRERK